VDSVKEDQLVKRALKTARAVLRRPLQVERGAALLYQVTVNNELAVTVDVKRPSRGYSAFQTDLCIFEQRPNGVRLPRVVLEFKARLTTHDVLTYSTKARKHKQVYPYLRYGVVVGEERFVPRRFFVHNEALDFCLVLGSTPRRSLSPILARFLRAEVRASRRLESIAYGDLSASLYRSEPTLGGLGVD
jgi:hypothetical protein